MAEAAAERGRGRIDRVRISIVIPVYNAERTIEPLGERLIELYAARCELELVLVNDASADGSDAACRRLRARHPGRITYLRLSRNFGEHNALMAGLHHAQGDWCITMDDDFQNPPEEVAVFLDALREDVDVIYADYADRADGWFRAIGSRVNDWLAVKALKKPRGLYLSSFRAINRFLVDEIKRYTGAEPYLDAIILRTTRAIGRITVRHAERRSGRSGYSFRRLVALSTTMFIAFSLYPIRLIGFVGVLLLLLGSYQLLEDTWLTVHPPPAGPPNDINGLSALIVFFRGLQLFVTGILGEYVGRLYLKSGNEPQFIVREHLAPPPAAGGP